MDAGPGTTVEQVRREARLVVRVAAGAGVGALLAAPFLLLLVLVVSEAEWLQRIDRDVADDLHRWALARPAAVTVLNVLAVVTSPQTFRLAVLVVAVLLWRAGSARLAIWAMTTMAVSGVLNVVLKELVARARPAFPDPLAMVNSYSFPSGHAQNAMTGAAVLLLVTVPLLSRAGRVTAWALAVVVVLVTGFDRVGLGVHFLSDVVAGWLVGLAVVVGTVVAFGAPHRAAADAPRPRRRSRRR